MLMIKQAANDITGTASLQSSSVSDRVSGKMNPLSTIFSSTIYINIYGPNEIDYLMGNLSDGTHMSGDANFACFATSCPAPFVFQWQAEKIA
jgi:hypothetical protein